MIQVVVCLATGPEPLPNWVFQKVRSWASSFNFQYLLASLRSSNSCLRLLPRHLVPLIFPSIMWLRRQFLRNMCPIQLAFLRLIVWRMFLPSFTLCTTAYYLRGQSNLASPSFTSTTFQNFPGTSDLVSKMIRGCKTFHQNGNVASPSYQYFLLGYEILTWGSYENSIFWDMTLCSPLKVSRRLEETYRLHLQG
jgi:hypothetical protein